MIRALLSGLMLTAVTLPAYESVGQQAHASTVAEPAQFALTCLGMAGFAAFSLVRRNRRSKH